ncbi:MSC_0620 family F1-like ATPase-associated subunit [Metamycoplasma neophronis]|uniref:Uncharacterized protein n=1 Tax=Metamycoplasma neophronis TaxID=872983 RepID=A0ABY2Z0W6_9BACT|nr:hypothetical protein [Metamycoplasma neophronis]TPR54061.1 hypothetical protein FJR74_01300 [Metamycoplasma neophronis]
MKKINKLLLLSSLSLPISTLPAIVVSANTNEKDNSTPKVAENFSTFKDIINEQIKEQIGELIDNNVNSLRDQANDLINSSDEVSSNGKEDIVRAVYLQKIADYLEKNKDAIKEDPSKYGFEIIYPRVISENQNLNKGNFTYGEEEFSNIIFGTEIGTSYDDILGLKKLSDEGKPYVNTDDLDTLKKKTEDYFSGLDTSFNDIFINDADIPTLNANDDNNRPLTKILFDEAHKGIEIKLPNGYGTWNEYIRSHIKPRFLKYDLDTNAEQSQEDIKQKPTVPPIIPDQPPIDPVKDNSDIQNVLNLNPYVKFEYYNSSNNDLIQLANNKNNLQLMFLFNNPINTRFQYSVTGLEMNNDKLMANIKIQDQLNLSSSREYKIEVLKNTSLQKTLVQEAQITYINSLMHRFYLATGIGDKMNFLLLPNKQMSLTVYNMIHGVINLYYQSDFQSQLQEINNKFESSYAGINKKPVVEENSEFAKALNNLFLGSLKNLEITLLNTISYTFFSYLPINYQSTYSDFKKSINEVVRSKVIYANFKKFDLDIANFENGLNVLKNNILALKGFSEKNGFNIYGDYLVYTTILTEITKSFNALGTLSLDQIINPETDKEIASQFKEAYKNLLTIKEYKRNATYKTVNVSLGIFFSVLTILAILGLTVTSLMKNKSKKKKIILIITLAIALCILIALSATFIALGIGGV